jgi:hypothetical protein
VCNGIDLAIRENVKLSNDIKLEIIDFVQQISLKYNDNNLILREIENIM